MEQNARADPVAFYAHADCADYTDFLHTREIGSPGIFCGDDGFSVVAGTSPATTLIPRGEVLKSRKIADKSVFGFSRVLGMERRGKGGDEAKKLRGKHEKAGRKPAERPFGSATAMVSRCDRYGMTSR